MSNTIGRNSGKISIVLKRKTQVDGNYSGVLQQNNAFTNEQQGEKRRRQINNEDEESIKKCQSYPIRTNEKNERREIAKQHINAFAHEKTAILSTLDCNNTSNKSMKTTNRCSPSIPSYSTAHKIPFLAFQGDQNPSRSPLSSSSSSSSSSANSSLHSYKRRHNSKRNRTSHSSISSTDYSSVSNHPSVHHRRTKSRSDSHHSSHSGSLSSTNEDYSTNSSCNSTIKSEEKETIEKSSCEEDDEMDDKEDNGSGLPAAFACARNGDERNGERNDDTAEMSDHEMQMMRRRQQLRNKERWHLLKYRLLTASGMNRNRHNDDKKEESIEWNEEKEREFVFSLL